MMCGVQQLRISPLGAQFIKMLLAWPPCSPDGTQCDFFLWGYATDQVDVPPLPASIPELKVQIRTTTETITADAELSHKLHGTQYTSQLETLFTTILLNI